MRPLAARPSLGSTDVPPFLSGLELAASFYAEVVAPRIDGIVHSAGLIGTGSDVLGYDDPRSTDHGWGPRLQVFLTEPEVEGARRALDGLPEEHRGWPTRIGSDREPSGSTSTSGRCRTGS